MNPIIHFPTIIPLGEDAAIVYLGDRLEAETARRARALAERIESLRFPGYVESVVAPTSVAIYYDPLAIADDHPFDHLRRLVEPLLATRLDAPAFPGRSVVVPVCYGGECGPDLLELMQGAGISESEAIDLHASAEYSVAMIGFAPGFPYLDGTPGELIAPRRSTPRTVVPAGSVAIGTMFTGIYPIATPGGWTIIGRTPLSLFDPSNDPPTLLSVGDVVRFEPITRDEFERISKRPNEW